MSDTSSRKTHQVPGRESPPPPFLRMQNSIRSSTRSSAAATTTPRRAISNSPSQGATQGHHSPDITIGLNSQSGPGRRWSNSEESDDEELMDIDEYSSKSDDSRGRSSSTTGTGGTRHQSVPVKKPTPSRDASTEENEFEWTDEAKATLYRAMLEANYLPVGIWKHWGMIDVHERFCTLMEFDKKINCKILWDHLESIYDLDSMYKFIYEKNHKDITLKKSEGNKTSANKGEYIDEDNEDFKIQSFELPSSYFKDTEQKSNPSVLEQTV